MATIEELGHVRFYGVLDDKNISAISFRNSQALIVSDEVTQEHGNVVQVFDPDGGDFRASSGGVILLDPTHQDDPVEMDLEGIEVDGQTVFVLGSHSWRRKKIDSENTYEKNRASLMEPPKAQPVRDVLLRFELDASGHSSVVERTSLRDFLQNTEPFASFSRTAGKENGIDVEGLAFWKQRLYVGFRGPVLRGGFTPILKFKYGSPIGDPEVLFINLGGRGVRDLAHTEAGLLVLAGPMGDGPGSYQLYLWDGRDGVPGSNAPTSKGNSGLRLLGDLPLPASADTDINTTVKPEGIAVTKETDQAWEVLIVFDGLADGHATRYRIAKPKPD